MTIYIHVKHRNMIIQLCHIFNGCLTAPWVIIPHRKQCCYYLYMYYPLTIEAQTKSPSLRRPHFKLIFSMKPVACWFKIAWSSFLGSILQHSGVVSDNSRATNRWWAIIWTKCGLVYWRLPLFCLDNSNHVSKMGPGERRDTTCNEHLTNGQVEVVLYVISCYLGQQYIYKL